MATTTSQFNKQQIAKASRARNAAESALQRNHADEFKTLYAQARVAEGLPAEVGMQSIERTIADASAKIERLNKQIAQQQAVLAALQNGTT